MKVSVFTEDKIKKTPRDVRNFIGSIASEKFKDYFMWHKKETPPIIYPLPHDNGFEIIMYHNNINMINDINSKLLKKPKFYETKVKSVRVFDYSYIPAVKSDKFLKYRTRTPMVISLNEVEYKICYNVNKDKIKLQKYLAHRIRSALNYQMKCYVGIDVIFNDLEVKLTQYSYFMTKDKDKHFPAIMMDFECNYILPEFLCYKIGLGYGQIKKEEDYRTSPLNTFKYKDK